MGCRCEEPHADFDVLRDCKCETLRCRRGKTWVQEMRNRIPWVQRGDKCNTLMCMQNGTAWCETRWETWYLGVQSDEKPDPGMCMRNGTTLRAHIVMCKEIRNVILDIWRGEKHNTWMHKRTEKWHNLMCEQVRWHTSTFFTDYINNQNLWCTGNLMVTSELTGGQSELLWWAYVSGVWIDDIFWDEFTSYLAFTGHSVFDQPFIILPHIPSDVSS